jgi:hypothetical protein
MNESKEEIVKNFIKAYNSFDIDSMLACLHPGVRFKNISGGEVNAQTIGKEDFEILAKRSVTMFKEREQKVIAIKEMNDKVNIEIQYHAIAAVDLPNGLKAGDSINIKGNSEYIFKDGLIYSIVDES